MRKRYFFVLLLVLTLLGCASVKKSIDNYEACKGDAVCVKAMEAAASTSYAVSKGVAGATLPSASEAIALGISSLVSFGVGVWRGRKLTK